MDSTYATFDFDGLEILSADKKNNAIMKCLLWSDDSTETEDCVVYLSRELLAKAMSEWLDGKARYWAGKGSDLGTGSIYLEGLVEKGEYNVRCWTDTANGPMDGFKKVRCFTANEVCVDMERG